MRVEDTMTQASPASLEQYVPPEKFSYGGKWKSMWAEAKHTFTTRDGLIGDYDYAYLFTPNIWPLNRKYKDHIPPFFYPDDKIPLLLILILGIRKHDRELNNI